MRTGYWVTLNCGCSVASKVVVKGMDALRHKLQNYHREAAEAAARGQYAAAQEIMLDAKRRAPEESGDMALSGYAAAPNQNSRGQSVEMGFGGKSEAYVVRQHEDTSLHHPALDGDSTKAGEHHFFSNAIRAKSASAKEIVASFVKQFLMTGKLPPKAKRLVPTSPR